MRTSTIILSFISHLVAILGSSIIRYTLLGIRPNNVGFDCTNISIRHTQKTATISNKNLNIFSLIFPICFVSVYEIILFLWSSSQELNWPGYSKTLFPLQLLKTVAVYFTAFNVQAIIGDLMKLTTGELRPYFIEVCMPNVTCSDPSISSHFINDYACHGDPANVRDARMSFPSDHAYCMTMAMVYICLYVDNKFYWDAIFIGKILFQFILVSLAIFVGISSRVDNQHHFIDVAVGIILGTATAFAAVNATNLFGQNLIINQARPSQHSKSTPMHAVNSTGTLDTSISSIDYSQSNIMQ
ncbi:putative phosphatidate phosphatase [Cimex lectularius]|uniref:Phosphatidic acid phosphatase type 2/haloperoxidase domain-containing protein n=1 Tax=Cimex lectularius TaxID=79782 RepID=A0A8I6SQ17_CIMLE|nr:putative phosphatidate phosphatase [Cimex lectularius]